MQVWFDQLRRAIPYLANVPDCRIGLHHDRRELAFWRRSERIISLNSTLVFYASKREVAVTLLHEMAHCLVRTPLGVDPHNQPAWLAIMRAAGVNPSDHAIIAGSPFDHWWQGEQKSRRPSADDDASANRSAVQIAAKTVLTPLDRSGVDRSFRHEHECIVENNRRVVRARTADNNVADMRHNHG